MGKKNCVFRPENFFIVKRYIFVWRNIFRQFKIPEFSLENSIHFSNFLGDEWCDDIQFLAVDCLFSIYLYEQLTEDDVKKIVTQKNEINFSDYPNTEFYWKNYFWATNKYQSDHKEKNNLKNNVKILIIYHQKDTELMKKQLKDKIRKYSAKNNVICKDNESK